MNATVKERVRMALAEAGYPHAEIFGSDHDPVVTMSGPNGAPDHIVWRAFRLAFADDGPCFNCWRDGFTCEDGSRTALCEATA
jgi:hypothetical protein